MPGPLWKFRYTDQWGKRRTTRYHLSEEDALKQYGPEAEKVEGSRIDPSPVGGTSEFRNGPKASDQCASLLPRR